MRKAAGVVVGAFVGLCLVRGLAGCGTPAELQCRVAAVRMLPDDPVQVTFGDVVDLTQRLHACKVPAGDAGQ
jgi:hypothetical protein